MDRFKRHLAKHIERWLADHAELEEALSDIRAGRMIASDEHRAALEGAVQSIAEAIKHLATFNGDRPKRR